MQFRKPFVFTAALAVGAAIALSSRAASGVSAAPSADSVLYVDVSEWKVMPSGSRLTAGPVTFEVAGAATDQLEHELQIIKTDLPATALPMKNGSEVDEDAVGEKIDEIEDIGPGETRAATYDLAPGHYVLFCNVPGHYQAGMVADLDVQ